MLIDPAFGPFFAGKVLATMGVWVHNVAAAILVHQLTGSALLVGAVSVGLFVPQLLLAPWSGARADRADRRRQVMVGVTVTASGSIGLAVAAATIGLAEPTDARIVIAAATVVGIGFAVGGPAMQAMIPALVRPSELTTAIAMTTLPMTIARAVGPALGALLVTRAGPVVAFATAGASHLIYLASLTRLRPRPRATDAPHGDDLLAGWRFARATPGVVALLLAIATIGVGVDPIITLTPSLVEALGRPATLVGSIASVFGLGAAGGLVLLRSVRGRLGLARTGTMGLIALTASMVGLAIATGPVSALTSATLGGVGMTLSLTTFTTLLQQGVPDGVRGRVMALWSIAFLGARPVTAGLLGAVADVLSIRTALLVAAVAIACGAYACRPSRTGLPTRPVVPAALTP